MQELKEVLLVPEEGPQLSLMRHKPVPFQQPGPRLQCWAIKTQSQTDHLPKPTSGKKTTKTPHPAFGWGVFFLLLQGDTTMPNVFLLGVFGQLLEVTQ